MPETVISTSIKISGNDASKKLCIIPESNLLKRLDGEGLVINGFRMREGMNYGYGDLLLIKSDIDAFKESNDLELTIKDGDVEWGVKKLTIVKAYNVYARGTGENDLYVVRVADLRYIQKFQQHSTGLLYGGIWLNPVTLPHPQKVYPTVPYRSSSFADIIGYYLGVIATVRSSNVEQNQIDSPDKIRDLDPFGEMSTWEAVNYLIHLITHGLYMQNVDQQSFNNVFVIKPVGIPNNTNTQLELTSNSNNRLMYDQMNVQSNKQQVPKQLMVVSSSMYEPTGFISYTHRKGYAAANFGHTETTFNGSTEIHIPNTFNVSYPDQAYRDEVEDTMDKVAELYYLGYNNNNVRNQVYFGLIPFEHGGDAQDVTFKWTPNGFITEVISVDMHQWYRTKAYRGTHMPHNVPLRLVWTGTTPPRYDAYDKRTDELLFQSRDIAGGDHVYQRNGNLKTAADAGTGYIEYYAKNSNHTGVRVPRASSIKVCVYDCNETTYAYTQPTGGGVGLTAPPVNMGGGVVITQIPYSILNSQLSINQGTLDGLLTPNYLTSSLTFSTSTISGSIEGTPI